MKQQADTQPDADTYEMVLDALLNIDQLSDAIKLYTEAGNLGAANESAMHAIFRKVVVTDNCSMFKRLLGLDSFGKDALSGVWFNDLIAASGKKQNLLHVLRAYSYMKTCGFPTTADTFEQLVDAFLRDDRIEEAKVISSYYDRIKSRETPPLVYGNVAIRLRETKNDPESCRRLWEENILPVIHEKGASGRALRLVDQAISTMASHGDKNAVSEMLNEVHSQLSTIPARFFARIIRVYAYQNDFDKCRDVLKLMKNSYMGNVQPDRSVYAALLRAAYLERNATWALHVFKGMLKANYYPGSDMVLFVASTCRAARDNDIRRDTLISFLKILDQRCSHLLRLEQVQCAFFYAAGSSYDAWFLKEWLEICGQPEPIVHDAFFAGACMQRPVIYPDAPDSPAHMFDARDPDSPAHAAVSSEAATHNFAASIQNTSAEGHPGASQHVTADNGPVFGEWFAVLGLPPTASRSALRYLRDYYNACVEMDIPLSRKSLNMFLGAIVDSERAISIFKEVLERNDAESFPPTKHLCDCIRRLAVDLRDEDYRSLEDARALAEVAFELYRRRDVVVKSSGSTLDIRKSEKSDAAEIRILFQELFSPSQTTKSSYFKDRDQHTPGYRRFEAALSAADKLAEINDSAGKRSKKLSVIFAIQEVLAFMLRKEDHASFNQILEQARECLDPQDFLAVNNYLQELLSNELGPKEPLLPSENADFSGNVDIEEPESATPSPTPPLNRLDKSMKFGIPLTKESGHSFAGTPADSVEEEGREESRYHASVGEQHSVRSGVHETTDNPFHSRHVQDNFNLVHEKREWGTRGVVEVDETYDSKFEGRRELGRVGGQGREQQRRMAFQPASGEGRRSRADQDHRRSSHPDRRSPRTNWDSVPDSAQERDQTGFGTSQ
eukprot:Rmarinus@m.13963